MVVNYLNKIRRTHLISLLILFSIIGLISAIYTASAHYGDVSLAVCSLNETFDCGTVNNSKWSEIVGIPVSVLGLISYALFIIGGVSVYKKPHELIEMLMGVLAIVGLGFSLYLTSIEAFVLQTWCLFCIASQIAILGIFICVMRIRAIDAKTFPQQEIA